MATNNAKAQTAGKAGTNKQGEDPRKASTTNDEAKATGLGRRQLLAKNEVPTPMLDKAHQTSPGDSDLVTAVVPKAFRLTCDDNTVIDYGVGIQDMPKSHATHWFSKAQGVQVKHDASED